MRIRKFSTGLGVALLLILAPLSGWGQTGNQGSVEGSVVDQSGGNVPNASLKATNEATGISFETTSDSNGLFVFPVLPVGNYTLVVSHSGFATVTQKNVNVTVGARLNLTISLALASQVASVTVTSEAPLIETARSQVSTTVSDRSVANLPVNGRNFINFVLLTPGVTLDVRGGDISFAGQRGTLNSLIVDGSDNNNTFFGQTVGRTGSGRAPYQFSQDAVQEFQVNSNAYSAELGHAGGAVINAVTKSGTNEFHGTAFEFYRDRAMNANDPINKSRGRPKSPYHFNQFGGNIGGPVLRDKAFFFFDYDGQRNTLPNLVFLNLPTGFTPTTPNQVTAFNYLNARAASWIRTQNEDVYLGKADWHISQGELLTVRYNSQRFRGANFENGGPQNASEHTGASNVTTDTLTASLTSTLLPSLINVFRFNYVRDDEPGIANSINPEATVFQGGQLVLTVGRNFFSPRFTNIHRGEFGDTLTYVRGRHAWKVGANFLVDRIGNFFPGNFSGQYVFRSLEIFGCNLNGGGASCIPPGDTSNTFAQAFAGPGTAGPTTKPNLNEFSIFGQDEWRIRSDLVLNLGLRWDYESIAQPPTLNPSAALAAAGIKTNQINRQQTEFGPRIGFAWTPFSSNRLVVRAGYGIFYGRTPAITVSTAFSNNGLNVQTLTFTGAGIPTYPNTECGAPVANPSCLAPTGGAAGSPIIFVFQRRYGQPYVQQASLGTEWKLLKDMALSVNYLWARGVHLTRTRDINLQGPETPTTIGIAGTTQTLIFNAITRPRPIPGFSRIEQFESNANSIYNGLTIQLNKRFGNNYQFLAGYTLGKVIDDRPDATSVVPFSFDDAKMIADPLNIRLDRAAGDNDQRHRFVLSGIWDLNNYASSLTPVGRAFLGGWQLSAIFTAQTGQPYSGQVNFDLNRDSNSRTDRTPGLGRNTFSLPKFVSLDPRITRNVKLAERARMQFIVEAFNVFNRSNFTDVNRTQFSRSTSSAACGIAGTPCLVPQTLFGTPNSTQINFTPGSRILQLAIKISF